MLKDFACRYAPTLFLGSNHEGLSMIAEDNKIFSSKTEFHAFEVDASIVNDLIYRQNGTISTALRELVMNAFDANTDKVEILIWSDGFDIKDNGQGFDDEESIMRNFKRFGAPHTEGDATYGRFRIGRGQVMAFAKTTWHSKCFQMITDIATKDAGFTFVKDAPFYKGCHVHGKFYNPLSSYDLYQAIEDVTKLVRYSPWPVFINQIQVNVDHNVPWNYEDEKVKITFNPKGQIGINLYSQGIFVKELQIYRFGIAADVVTKQALQLNMARNEINENDPLWRHVYDVLRETARKRLGKKNKLTEFERLSLIDQFNCGDLSFVDIFKLPLLKDVRGKVSSFQTQLGKKRPWTVADDEQSSVADSISTFGNAFVLSRSELDTWLVDSLEELIEYSQINLGDISDGNQIRFYLRLLRGVQIEPFSNISNGIRNHYTLLLHGELSPIESAQRNALQYTLNNMCKRLEKVHGEPLNKRKVHVGTSHAMAWTDSSTYVAINRKTLSLFENSMQGLTQLAAILLHELTHREGSMGSNGHDMAFYESFHDSVICSSIQNEVLGNAISSLRNQYASELEKKNLPFPKWMSERAENTVEISLLGKKPTPALIWFLNLVDLPFVRGRGSIVLNLSAHKLSELRKTVVQQIDLNLRKHDLPVIKIEQFDHLSDYKVRSEAYRSERLLHIEKLLELEQINSTERTKAIIADYSNYSPQCMFGGITSLAADTAFGIKSLHRQYRRSVKIMAGKEFSFSSNFRDDWRDREMTASGFADGGKEGRFLHYKNILQELVDGITCPTEKEEFLKRAFNDDMIKSLS